MTDTSVQELNSFSDALNCPATTKAQAKQVKYHLAAVVNAAGRSMAEAKWSLDAPFLSESHEWRTQCTDTPRVIEPRNIVFERKRGERITFLKTRKNHYIFFVF